MEPFIGEIKMFGGNFAPRGWQLCQGQLLPIVQNQALFSILGTTYGGNGQTTFALPDLRGRFPMQPGQGPGLSPRTLGHQGGSEAVTLLANQMPAHNHMAVGSNAEGNQFSPEGGFPAVTLDPASGQPLNLYGGAANVPMNPAAIGVAGGSQPHENMPPFTCVNFIIALEGVYPTRN
jgi:microcystin-dependent protein